MKPLTLSHFATERDVWTGIKQWQQITDWQREGLLSVKPLTQDRARVVLTERGVVAAQQMEGGG